MSMCMHKYRTQIHKQTGTHVQTLHAVTARKVARESKVERHSAIFRELDGIRRQVRFRDLECICRLPAHGPFKRLYLEF